MGVVSGILIILVTILCPPIGVLFVAGCGMDFFVNICLTILGVFPGHIHAFYVLYIYYDRRELIRQGGFTVQHAPGIYSENVQTGGMRGYGTVAPQA